VSLVDRFPPHLFMPVLPWATVRVHRAPVGRQSRIQLPDPPAAH
jgi:hypothetical protein